MNSAPLPTTLNDIHGLADDLARAYAISLLEKTVQASALDGGMRKDRRSNNPTEIGQCTP